MSVNTSQTPLNNTVSVKHYKIQERRLHFIDLHSSILTNHWHHVTLVQYNTGDLKVHQTEHIFSITNCFNTFAISAYCKSHFSICWPLCLFWFKTLFVHWVGVGGGLDQYPILGLHLHRKGNAVRCIVSWHKVGTQFLTVIMVCAGCSNWIKLYLTVWIMMFYLDARNSVNICKQ